MVLAYKSAYYATVGLHRELGRTTIAFHADRPRASASARSAAWAAFFAFWRAVWARISAPMIRPPQITSRFLVLIAGHYSGLGAAQQLY